MACLVKFGVLLMLYNVTNSTRLNGSVEGSVISRSAKLVRGNH